MCVVVLESYRSRPHTLLSVEMKKSRAFGELVRPSQDSDSGAQALVRTADEQIDLWYDQYAGRLRGHLLLWSCGNRAHYVDDAVNETFLRLFRALRSGTSIDNPYAWVCRVARHLMMDEIKRGSKEASCGDVVEAVCDPAPTPDVVLFKRRKETRLARAFSMLSDLERECLDLRASGLTHTEIGMIVRLRHQRVSEVVCRAIARLAEIVGE